MTNDMVFSRGDFINDNIDSCQNTYKGECQSMSLEDCVQTCKDINCNFGFYDNFKCGIIKNPNYENINPLYTINFDKPDKIVFINKTKISVPPQHTNCIFFGDLMKISTSGKFISSKNIIPENNDPIITSDQGHLLQIAPVYEMFEIQQYQPVKYGEYVMLFLPQTTVAISGGAYNTMKWSITPMVYGVNDFAIQFIPINSNLNGKFIKYGDKFKIVYSGNLQLYNNDDQIKTVYGEGDIFTALPHVMVYDEKCKTYPLSEKTEGVYRKCIRRKNNYINFIFIAFMLLLIIYVILKYLLGKN